MSEQIDAVRALVASEIERAMWNHGVRLTPSQKRDTADAVVEALAAMGAPQQPEAQVGGDDKCAACADTGEVFSDTGEGPFRCYYGCPPPSAMPRGWRSNGASMLGRPTPSIAEGFAVVPEIATEEMVEAIIDQGRHGGDEISHTTAHMIWADAVMAWQHRGNRAAAPNPGDAANAPD